MVRVKRSSVVSVGLVLVVAACKDEAPSAAPPAAPPPAAPVPAAPPPAAPPPDATTQAYARWAELAVQEEPSFETLTAFLASLDALPAPTDPAAVAKLELTRAQVLAKTLDVLAPVGTRSPAQDAFLKACGDKVEENELAGRHFLEAGRLWKLATAHASTPSGEGFAWLASGTPSQGECEGFLPCVLARAEGADGEYLKRFPTGAHAGEALSNLRAVLPALDEPSLAELAALDATDRTSARDSLKTLLGFVSATSHAEKAATQAALKALDDALAKLPAPK